VIEESKQPNHGKSVNDGDGKPPKHLPIS